MEYNHPEQPVFIPRVYVYRDDYNICKPLFWNHFDLMFMRSLGVGHAHLYHHLNTRVTWQLFKVP